MVKRPLVACLVGYAWVSELCASSLNKQLGTFSFLTLLTKTSSDEVHLSSTLSPERFTEPAVLPCSEPIVIFRGPSLWHLTARLNSSPGVTKLGPVGPALLIVLLKIVNEAGPTLKLRPC